MVSIPVGAATVKIGDIDVYLNGLGNVVPRYTVTVRTRVEGELMRVRFREGQYVKAGELLAELDARPFAAQLEQAEGQMMRDQALLKQANIDLERYKTLYAQDSIAKQQLDLQVSLVKQYEGAVKNDRGLINNAKTQLIYTKISSPIDGRVGLRQVDPGNIVRASDPNGIVVVTQLQPITCIFTIPEDQIPEVMKYQKQKLTTEAWDRDNKVLLATGVLIAIDNQVDQTTGTVKFRSEFPNKNNELFPSQFVNVRLRLDTKKGVVLMPTSGIQRGSKGTFAYVITSDKTVKMQPIKLGIIEGGKAIVESGLNAGDQVVIDGSDSLRDGAKVEISYLDEAKTAFAAAASEGKLQDEIKPRKHNKKSSE